MFFGVSTREFSLQKQVIDECLTHCTSQKVHFEWPYTNSSFKIVIHIAPFVNENRDQRSSIKKKELMGMSRKKKKNVIEIFFFVVSVYLIHYLSTFVIRAQ